MAITQPDVTYLLDSYRFLWPSMGIDVIIDRLHEDKSGLQCEATILVDHPPISGLVRQGRFNISATRTRSEWVNVLAREYEGFPWHDIFEAICALSLRRWRDGAPTIDLADVPQREGVPFLLDPLVVESEASLLFGDGGSGKSLLAVAIAATIATGEPILGIEPKFTGPVLYLDWEWDEYEHASRLRAVCDGYGIKVPHGTIFYRRELSSLHEGASSIRREIASKGIRFTIGDSLGFARGGEPESAELTLKTFAAARTFGVPCLFIDHIPKDAKDKRYSFGSVYTRNSVRASWRIDAAKSGDGMHTSMGLTQAKENLGWMPPMGLNMTIETTAEKRLKSVVFESTDYKRLPAAAKRTLADQIGTVLDESSVPLQAPEVYERLRKRGVDCKEDSVKVTLASRKDLYARGERGYTRVSPIQEEVFS